MTTRELVYHLQILLAEHPKIKTRVFDTFDLVKMLEMAHQTVYESYRDNYTEDEKTRKALNKLIKNVIYTTFSVENISIPKNYVVSLPSDCDHVIMETADILSATSQAFTSVMVKPVTYDQYMINKGNPLRNPNIELLWRLDYGDGTKKHILILPSGYTPTAYSVVYLRKPTSLDYDLNTESEINYPFDIINLALKLIVEGTLTFKLNS